MTAESAAALRILMNDDLYLRQEDFHQPSVVDIIIEAKPVLLEQPAQSKIAFSGKNLKNILVLTDEPILENHLKALESTLARKQLNLDDVALVDFSAQNDLTYENLHASFMPQKLVLFGLNPEKLGLPETAFNQVIQADDLEILYTYNFTEMLGNKEKTKAFWEPMKNL